jgi:hypothetical protein
MRVTEKQKTAIPKKKNSIYSEFKKGLIRFSCLGVVAEFWCGHQTLVRSFGVVMLCGL